MSPLQYQKRIRLQQAQQIMLQKVKMQLPLAMTLVAVHHLNSAASTAECLERRPINICMA